MRRFMFVSRCFIGKNGKWLLVRRADTDSHHAGLWECPGGKIEEERGFGFGRVREVAEETGLIVEPVTKISYVEQFQVHDGPYAGVSGLRIFSIMKPLDEYKEVELDEREHDTFAWVTYPEMIKYDLTPEVRAAAEALSEYLF